MTDAQLARRIVENSAVTPSGCWQWQRYCESLGYGRIKVGGRRGRVRYAHVVAYEAFVGPVPEDHEVDHVCRNRGCVNPEHLEAVTTSENVKRSWRARRAVDPTVWNGNQYQRGA